LRLVIRGLARHAHIPGERGRRVARRRLHFILSEGIRRRPPVYTSRVSGAPAREMAPARSQKRFGEFGGDMNGRRGIIALVLWVFAACVYATPASAWQPHVLRFAEGIDVTTLDPFLATSANVSDLSGLTMAYFVRYDAQRRPVPELITKIPSQANGGISADGRTITYHLKHGVRWSDGAPFDADDVAYTLRVVADRSNLLTTRDAWDRILRFDEPDKFTIVLHLDRPFAPFIARYFGSDGLGCVLPVHILGAHTNINRVAYNALPVGIGPFRYTAFRRGDAIEMEANPYYFGRKPKLRKIVYSLVSEDNTLLTQLQTGELDMWASVSGGFTERVQGLPNVRSERVPTPFMSGIFFQTEHPALREALVRRALRLATNRPYFFNVLYHRLGTLAESVVAPSTRDSAQLRYIPFDPARANKLLDGDGWLRGPDGVRTKSGTRLSLTIAVLAGYTPTEQLAELLRTSWSAVGAEVTTKPSSSALFFAPADAGGTVQSGNFDVALLSQSSGVFADVSNSYGCAYRSPKGLNSTRYCNPAVDREIAAYIATYDARKAAALARRFQQRIDDDAPMVPVYARAFLYAHTSHLTGFHPQTFGVFDAIADADVQ
jgi:peptide/nickel transport system substrate-binding protein